MKKGDKSFLNLYFRPSMYNIGHGIDSLGGPTMIAGIFHGFARSISIDYLRFVSKSPSGAVIFLSGLGMRIVGCSMIDSFSEKKLINNVDGWIEFIENIIKN